MNEIRQAWECPRCHRINAWWKDSCDCTIETVSVSNALNQYKQECLHDYINVVDTPSYMQYACKKCGKIHEVSFKPLFRLLFDDTDEE